MKYEIYLDDDLARLIEKDAADRSLLAPQFIPQILATLYKDKLSGSVIIANYSKILCELKDAITAYVETHKGEFVLRQVPYYRELPDNIKVRIARSVNSLVCKPTNDFTLASVIKRSYRNGKPKLRNGAAVYEKIGG